LEALLDLKSSGSQGIDSTHGPSLRRRGKRGAQEQAIGRSRGGRTTKIHAVANASGRLTAFNVTAGPMGGVRAARGACRRVVVFALLGNDAFLDALLENTPMQKTRLLRRPNHHDFCDLHSLVKTMQ
jgi:hypothetical protein